MSNARPDDSARPEHATEMLDLSRPHAEIIDSTNQQVWQTIEPCSAEDFGAFDLPDPYRPVGVGYGSMDEVWFDRSPGAEVDGPMREREIVGRRWGHCANVASPPGRPFGAQGPVEMIIEKHHGMRFAAGRRVPVLRSPEGEYFVHVIEGRSVSSIGTKGPSAEPMSIPEGCALGQVTLESDWVLRLPAPTRVFFLKSGDSFQGPVESLPSEWVATSPQVETA